MIDAERERDRAVRIAYGHARRGEETAARQWLTLAGTFSRTTAKQAEHLDKLLRAAGPVLIPGQLELVGSIARAQRLQAVSRGYRPAELRYG